MKPDFPAGGLPAWTEHGSGKDGKDFKINEAAALARYLSRKIGIYPSNLDAAHDVDATHDFIFEKWGNLATIALNGAHDADSEKTYMDSSKAIMEKMNRKLTNKKTKFISGNKLTFNDFQMAHVMWTYWENAAADQYYPAKCKPMIASYPELEKYLGRLQTELKKTLDTRKPSPW